MGRVDAIGAADKLLDEPLSQHAAVTVVEDVLSAPGLAFQGLGFKKRYSRVVSLYVIDRSRTLALMGENPPSPIPTQLRTARHSRETSPSRYAGTVSRGSSAPGRDTDGCPGLARGTRRPTGLGSRWCSTRRLCS